MAYGIGNGEWIRRSCRSGSQVGAAVSATLLAMQVVSPAHAAPSAQVTSELEQVVVTATRRDELVLETPVAVSVVNVDDAINAGVVDINALADFVPGLTATDGGAPGLGNLVIRGLYTGGGAATVGIYVDDVPYGPVLGGAGSSIALDASLFDLERIEVVRGPQGTLFGSSAMGGVVRYVTRAPSLERLEGFSSLDVSSTDGGGTNTLVRGRVSVPLAEERFAISAGGFYSDASGYIDHPLRDKKDVDGSTFWGAQFGAAASLTEKFSLRLSALHQEAEYDAVSAEAFNLGTGARLLGPREDVATQATPRNLEFDLFAAVIDYDFGWATLSSATSWQNVELRNESDLTQALGPLADLLAPAGAPHSVGFVSAFDTERFTQELRLTSPANETLEWLVGAYYTDQDTDDTQNVNPVPDDVELLNASLPTAYEELAIFGNVTYYITPRWDVTAGLRISDIETRVDSRITGSPFLIGPGPFPSGTLNSDTVSTYLANTRYRVSDALNLYARAANGYRPGGANLIVQVGGTTIGEPRYKPDDLWSYEAGVKGSFLGGRAVYDVGAYYVDWSDAQLVNVASGLGATTNAQGDVRATGIEASLSGELIERLMVVAAFNLADTELQSDEPVLGGTRGEQLPNVPDMTVSIAADYGFDITDSLEGSVGATWRHTGEYTTSYEGGGGIAPALPNYTNDSYDQFDLRAGVRVGKWALNAYVTNLTDEDAYQTIFPIAPTYAQGIILRPRTYGVNVRFDF